jgi:hypothetical protein
LELNAWQYIKTKTNNKNQIKSNQMAKVKKVTKKELESIQNLSSKYSKISSDVGSLELNKQDLLMELNKTRQEIESEKTELQKKYGDVNINLQTGEYSENNKED